MKVLFSAIKTRFDATPNDFYTAMGGRLYFYEAEQGATYPYCVYQMISDAPEYYFNDERFEDFLIQFSIFDNDQSAVGITDDYEALKTHFDDVSLSVTGYTNVVFEREGARLVRNPTDNVWQYSADYRVMCEKN